MRAVYGEPLSDPQQGDSASAATSANALALHEYILRACIAVWEFWRGMDSAALQ